MSPLSPERQLLLEGMRLFEAGELAEAEQRAREILARDPSEPEALQLLGLIAFDSGYQEQGLQLLQGAVGNQPENPLLHINLAQRLLQANQMEQSLHHYELAIALDPQQVIALNMCGILYQETHRLTEALEMFQRALALQPRSSQIKYNLAVALQKQQQFKPALNYVTQVLQDLPTYTDALNLRGILRQELGQLDKAQQDFEKVLKLEPEHGEAHFNLGNLKILRAQLPAGWDEFEWRWSQPGKISSFGLPRWQGQPLATGERILFFDDAGFGDSLQFVRYLLEGAIRPEQIVLRCQDALCSLFRAQGWPFAIVSDRELLPEGLNYEFPLLSFPSLRRTGLEQMPVVSPPYLKPPSEGPRLPATASDYALRVGFIWAGSPENAIDLKRSCELDWFLKLSESLPRIFWASLQKSPQAQTLASRPLPANVWNADALLTSFRETAALVAQLDLVIAVDTSVVHLAGAMNWPVWVLLPMVPDWRWFTERDDSPWYPNTRLFRQRERNDWKQVFRQVRQALDQRLSESGEAHSA